MNPARILLTGASGFVAGHLIPRLRTAFPAAELTLCGEGLVPLDITECRVPQAQLMDEAMKMAANIAAKSPIATRMAKQAAQTIEFMTLRDGYRFEQNLTHELSRTEDAREAMMAFVEKRKPNFKGR